MKTLLIRLFVLTTLLWLVAGMLPAETPPVEDPATVPREEAGTNSGVAPAFRIVGLEDRPKLRDTVRIAAVEARFRIREKTSLDWDGTALIVWADENLFLEKTGFRPESSAAAASPAQMTVWINEAAWQRSTNQQRQETMTHEVAHLLLGMLPGGEDLPLWANEGLVMHLAGQWSPDDHMRLLAAHAAGSLPTLDSLSESFPRDGDSQSLAYWMSYAAVDVVAQNYGDEPGQVRRLMQRLADPVHGPVLAREFSDAFRVEGWQTATIRALGSRLTTVIIVLTSTTSVFLIILILAVVAYWRRAARGRQHEHKWAEEDEPWAESLTEEDIQDIYGDREERWKGRGRAGSDE